MQKITNEKNRQKLTSIRIKPELKAKLTESARANERTFNKEVTFRLQQSLGGE